MPNKAFFIILAAVSVATAQFAFREQDANPKSNPQRPSNQHLVDARSQPLGTDERDRGRLSTTSVAMAANDKVINVPVTRTLDDLLVTDQLSDFSEAELTRIINLCQDKRNPGSDTACKVFLHWNALASKQEQNSGQMEAVWVEAEKNAGMAFEENTELTPLVEKQISQSAGGDTDNLESVLQNLEERALNDPSPDQRHQALQEIVLMGDVAFMPMLENALNDENPANRELAAEGLRKLRETDKDFSSANAGNQNGKTMSGSPHYSLADIPN